ncbi:S41 family peptidase [Caulobacter sp.]|uniref:S41 family peptidase n=1 Tax=Caulobacter sp. TaxID=78 RepID=UPI003BA985F4
MVLGALALGGAGLIGLTAWEAERARRDPVAARIAHNEKVFDAVWNTVDRKYYAADFDHERWRRLRDVFRPRARAAGNEAELYINVLTNMLNAIGASHLGVSMPPPSLPPPPPRPATSAAKTSPAPTSRKLFGCGGLYLKLTPGVELATVRRGADQRMRVADVSRGSAAERAGIAPGDIIHSFTIASRKNGCPHARMTLSTPGNAPRQVAYDIEDRPERPPVQRVDLPSGVRILRFDGFNRESLRWLDDALAAAPAKGLVLDLRHNGGGEIWVETRIVSDFLRPDSAMGTQVAHGKARAWRSKASKVRYDGPLVVLIGPASASAAEITAAVMRHHRRALLVGSETAGAVLTSRSYRLPDGGHVIVAVADYHTPDGRRLEGAGVRPDRPVAQTLEAIRAGRDLPLEVAERAILAGEWRP